MCTQGVLPFELQEGHKLLLHANELLAKLEDGEEKHLLTAQVRSFSSRVETNTRESALRAGETRRC